MTTSEVSSSAVDEILAWLRVQNREHLRTILSEVLSTKNDRTVYELTDGNRKAKEVSDVAKVAKSTVSEKWKTWRAIGILIETEDRWKPRHLLSIESLGGLPD